MDNHTNSDPHRTDSRLWGDDAYEAGYQVGVSFAQDGEITRDEILEMITEDTDRTEGILAGFDATTA